MTLRTPSLLILDIIWTLYSYENEPRQRQRLSIATWITQHILCFSLSQLYWHFTTPTFCSKVCSGSSDIGNLIKCHKLPQVYITHVIVLVQSNYTLVNYYRYICLLMMWLYALFLKYKKEGIVYIDGLNFIWWFCVWAYVVNISNHFMDRVIYIAMLESQFAVYIKLSCRIICRHKHV